MPAQMASELSAANLNAPPPCALRERHRHLQHAIAHLSLDIVRVDVLRQRIAR